MAGKKLLEQNQFYYDTTTKWLHSGGQHYQAPRGGIGKLLFDKIKYYADQNLICQIESETGNEETYQDFFIKCIKIALYLKDAGLKAGDIISMCSQNNMVNSAVFIGALFNGIILAPTDPLTSLDDSKYLLELVEPKLMFVCQKSLEVNQHVTEEKNIKLITLYDHDNLEHIQAIFEKYTEDETKQFIPYFAEDNNEIINIQFSSGTSGMPKATCLNHHMLVVDTGNVLGPGVRGTIFTTLYWGTTVAFVCNQLCAGGIIVNSKVFNPETTWKFLKKTRCNFVFFSYGLCMQSVPYLKESLPDLKIIWVGGGYFPVRFQEQVKAKIPHLQLMTSYGMTEIGSVTKNVGQCAPESSGFIDPTNIILKIVDIDTEQAVDLNVVGEIRVKGKNQLNGYYKRDSKDIWDHEGFFKTGDLGYLNDKYELYVVDRIKEMFKYRGYHVIPEKIEKVLLTHPAVKHAIVIPIRHLTDDSHAKGLVVLKKECTVDANELVTFTNSNIFDTRNHLRAGVQFINEEDITFTVTNKINRLLLRQKFQK